MHELIPGIVWVVILCREPQIWRLPDPDRERIDTGNDDPLSDVELLA